MLITRSIAVAVGWRRVASWGLVAIEGEPGADRGRTPPALLSLDHGRSLPAAVRLRTVALPLHAAPSQSITHAHRGCLWKGGPHVGTFVYRQGGTRKMNDAARGQTAALQGLSHVNFSPLGWVLASCCRRYRMTRRRRDLPSSYRRPVEVPLRARAYLPTRKNVGCGRRGG